MNTCIVCLGEENSDNLIEYNHCGLYHIHKECLKRWQKDECIICREKKAIINNPNNDNNNNSNVNCNLCIVATGLCPILSGLLCTLVIIFI